MQRGCFRSPSEQPTLDSLRQTFSGIADGLTDEGLASLALFLPSDTSAAGEDAALRLRRGHDALRAPLFEHWKRFVYVFLDISKSLQSVRIDKQHVSDWTT